MHILYVFDPDFGDWFVALPKATSREVMVVMAEVRREYPLTKFKTKRFA